MEILSFEETKKILKKYKISFCRTEIFNSQEKALAFAEKIGFPVVLKIHSRTIFHKSDIGGVKIGIQNSEEFHQAWKEISTNSQLKNIEGILVQEMVQGSELALGMKRDNQFGPILMFGLGGIFIEVLKDVSFRIAPIDRKQALEMIKEIKGYRLLEGYRGKKGVDIKKITDLIIKISNLAIKEKNILSLDFNPIMANDKKVLVADFRLII
ncbi:MAG: acetate--CoA ligase family protein [Candidatus Paceibacterota bacterium]